MLGVSKVALKNYPTLRISTECLSFSFNEYQTKAWFNQAIFTNITLKIQQYAIIATCKLYSHASLNNHGCIIKEDW